MNFVITPAASKVNISPIGFHHYAGDFAKHAHEAAAQSGDRFSPVPYYLYCHSLELVLKAFLLAKGVLKADLKKKRLLGHDLSKILAKARTLGIENIIPLEAGWEAEIYKANTYYGDKGFEYFDLSRAVPGYPELPALNVLNEIVTNLLRNLEQVCLAA